MSELVRHGVPMNQTSIKELLARTSEIRKKHEQIASLTGERFNVFEILGLQTLENRTHSAFLGELLDPKGTHGLRDVFLKAFFRMITKHGISCHTEAGPPFGERFRWNDETLNSARVILERHLGEVSADGATGGRVDIVIETRSGEPNILIENKIHAADQDSQLVRYHNADPRALLIYLTLDGSEASNKSAAHEESGVVLTPGSHYFPISYKVHILEWLQECKKEATEHPLVRETIAQYIHLIRDLTEQNHSNKMDEEIVKAVLDGKSDTLLAFGALCRTHDLVKQEVFKLIKPCLIAIGEKHGFSTSDAEINLTGQHFTYWNDNLLKTGLVIDFNFERGKWLYGFKRLKLDSPGEDITHRLNKRFSEVTGSIANPTPWWPAWRWWIEYPNWDTDFDTLAPVYYKEDSEFLVHFDCIIGQMKDIAASLED